MKGNVIFMISGKAGSGKDAVANALEQQLMKDGYPVLRIAFADAVKDMLTRYYDWDGNKDEHGRAMLQELGTTKMRAMFPTYWAELVAKFIAATHKDWLYVLISDWRFVNEFDTISDYNTDVVTIRVDRYNEDGTEYINTNMTDAQREHVSETELDKFPFDYVIENRGTLEELEDNVLAILEDMNN